MNGKEDSDGHNWRWQDLSLLKWGWERHVCAAIENYEQCSGIKWYIDDMFDHEGHRFWAPKSSPFKAWHVTISLNVKRWGLDRNYRLVQQNKFFAHIGLGFWMILACFGRKYSVKLYKDFFGILLISFIQTRLIKLNVYGTDWSDDFQNKRRWSSPRLELAMEAYPNSHGWTLAKFDALNIILVEINPQSVGAFEQSKCNSGSAKYPCLLPSYTRWFEFYLS